MPYFIGDPGRIRTCDLQLRRLLLYPLSYGAVRVFSVGVLFGYAAITRWADHSTLAARAYGILLQKHNSVSKSEAPVRPLLIAASNAARAIEPEAAIVHRGRQAA
jgi:hypothetical protein